MNYYIDGQLDAAATYHKSLVVHTAETQPDTLVFSPRTGHKEFPIIPNSTDMITQSRICCDIVVRSRHRHGNSGFLFGKIILVPALTYTLRWIGLIRSRKVPDAVQ